MTIETRPVDREQAVDYARAVNTGFHNLEHTDLEWRAEGWVDGRWWAALDAEQIVATVRTMPQHTTIPGGAQLATSGLTAVTTRATHRRRGLLSRMIDQALRADKEAGEPLATLIAAEWPIYGRFGYGAASEHATYRLEASARWRNEGRGTIELVDADVFEAEAPGIYVRHHAANVSEISRSVRDWRYGAHGLPSKPKKQFIALCRDDAGVATGYAMYKIGDLLNGRQPEVELTLHELIAADHDSEARLWRYLCEIDWVKFITAPDRSVVERVPWWLEDARHFRQTARSDFVWARPLDMAVCLTARAYATPIDTVIEVVDPLNLAGGRFHLHSDGDAGTSPLGGESLCTPTTSQPDVTLPIATLGSILFGGYDLALLAATGHADEHAVGAIRKLATAFRTATPPWSATWF